MDAKFNALQAQVYFLRPSTRELLPNLIRLLELLPSTTPDIVA